MRDCNWAVQAAVLLCNCSSCSCHRRYVVSTLQLNNININANSNLSSRLQVGDLEERRRGRDPSIYGME